MPININITDDEQEAPPQEPEGVKIEVVEKDNKCENFNDKSSNPYIWFFSSIMGIYYF